MSLKFLQLNKRTYAVSSVAEIDYLCSCYTGCSFRLLVFYVVVCMFFCFFPSFLCFLPLMGADDHDLCCGCLSYHPLVLVNIGGPIRQDRSMLTTLV